MAELRKGRQTPTQSVVLPYFDTKGQDAIDSYNESGRTAQEWQELLLSDILAVNEDELWTHTKFGYSVPRRNGKNVERCTIFRGSFNKASTSTGSLRNTTLVTSSFIK